MAAGKRLCAVSVDLDEIPHYFKIHGLSTPKGAIEHLVYDRALDRLLTWAESLRIPLTLFVVARDLERQRSVDALRAFLLRSDEIGNHTLDHHYNLVQLGRAEITRQIADGRDRIASTLSTKVRGFRAPGYNITDEVFDVLAELGVEYDSSVFPCAAYFLAKQAVLSSMHMIGRMSDAIPGESAHLFGPTSPYRVGKPYWTRGKGLKEVPIQVTRGPRLPFIGTSIVVTPTTFMMPLMALMHGVEVVNLELHGIDFLEAADGLNDLRSHQPDMRIELRKKTERLTDVVRALQNDGYKFVRVHELASSID